MAKDNKVIVGNLYSTVENNIKQKKIMDELFIHISKYFDYNSDKIFNALMTEKVLFLNSDKESVYTASGLNPSQIRDTIKKSEYIKDTWRILNEPLNTASILIIRYLTIAKKHDELKIFLTYYSFYFYSSIYHKYLPYGANESIMAYTINNLSNKFKIKQLGSLYKVIEHTAMTCHEKYEKELIRGEDGDLAKYVSGLKVRINDFVKNIKNEYTINHKNNKFMNYDVEDKSEENYREVDNTSFAVQRISDNATNKIMVNGPDMRLSKIAAQLSQVSQSEIRNVILQLSDDDIDNIHRLCELILQLFLFDPKNSIEDVGMSKFLMECMEIYKKSNTNDPMILEIKEILDTWLMKYSEKYKKTNRAPTLSNFRRAIFTYFVLHIQINTR